MKKEKIKPVPVCLIIPGDEFEYKRFIRKTKKKDRFAPFCCVKCLIKIYC